MVLRTQYSLSAVSSGEAHRSAEPALARGLWSGSARRVLLPGLFAAFAACTLSDEFHPVQIDQLANREQDAGTSSPACPGGDLCCASVPCAEGQLCREGACEALPPLSSPDAGGCGSECPLPESLSPPESSCADGVLGPDETDRDCGGVCGSTCQADQRCAGAGDCESGVCSPESSRCAASTCTDGQRNGAELLTDCGGGTCPCCPDATPCSTPLDCQSGVCGSDGRCAAASCTDDVKNGAEADVDCGGSCDDCPTGRACSLAEDCQSGVCAGGGCRQGVGSCCQASRCNDGVRNGSETDTDCGGRCPDCPTGLACGGVNDCQSRVCAAGGCAMGTPRCCQAPSCTDGVRNGAETGSDCGAGCGLCPLAAQCALDAECQSGFCQAGRCADPGTCNDGLRNGTETAVDCGGNRCPRCADRLACQRDADCINNNCADGVCISCGDGVTNGSETGIDCGGVDPFCRRCEVGQRCLIGSDCISGVCNGGFC